MREAEGWIAALNLAVATAENFAPGTLERQGAEAVAKAIYRRMVIKGISVMTPAWIRRP